MTRPAWLVGSRAPLRPPPTLSLSQWAEAHYVLSAESAAMTGRFVPYPFQREILDAFTDPTVEWITVMKSARVGATKFINMAIGYCIAADPCSVLVVQPTIDDARGYAKEELVPMLRDVAVLTDVVGDPAERDPDQTTLHRMYPGGVMSLVGANSARGFRRTTRRVALLDEIDGYPPSAGNEGDQIELAVKRTETFHDRKIVTVSSPTDEAISRIEPLYLAGDRRRYHVPCPLCGHFDFLTPRPRDDRRGHVMRWPKDDPASAYFECSGCGGAIEHRHKRSTVEAGKWIAEAEFRGHASFHIWAAYSFSPGATWGAIAERYSKAAHSGNALKLKTVINLDFGETWKERGEAPDHEQLFKRRERYQIGTVPAGVLFLTGGVDVQIDRLMYEVVGWNAWKESFSVEAGELTGDTSGPEPWQKLDELQARTFPRADGGPPLPIAMLGVDSGFKTQTVYNWCRGKSISRVIATKGSQYAKTLVGTPSAVDVHFNGRRIPNGYRVWNLGVDIAKDELYGWLKLKEPLVEGEYPPGWCHFPEYAEGYFEQLTAERKVPVRTRHGYTVWVWRIQENRENHYLDCRVIARACASILGLDRHIPPATGTVSAAAVAAAPRPAAAAATPPRPAPPPRQPSGFYSKGGGRRPRSGGSSWYGRRR